jgi:glycosyltransferase involved in cell wall biosynthesis
MPIALVTNYLPGYRQPLYRLLAERLGVEVYCFGGEGSYVSEQQRDLDRQLASAPFPAHALPSQRDAFRLAERHEAVIAGTTGRIALPAAYLGARRRGRPFLLWASLWRQPRTAAHLASFALMRHLYRRADAILTYGPHVSRYVARYRGSESGVFAAPQCVEADLFGRDVAEAEVAAWRAEVGVPDGPLVLFAGRLVREKGVEVLLDAWRSMADSKANLCLIGDGPLRGSVVGVGERVFFAGSLPRERLPVAYAAADVVVVPSIETRRFLEPWGLVCNEAMNQGRAVIATTAVGAAAGRLVRDGETGLVVPAGDERALAGAVDGLLQDPVLRARLGSNGKAALEAYRYERAAAAFTRALEAAGATSASTGTGDAAR